VTEFPIGTRPIPQLFPVRSRVISGLALRPARYSMADPERRVRNTASMRVRLTQQIPVPIPQQRVETLQKHFVPITSVIRLRHSNRNSSSFATNL
jgi:hypothetical protein